MPINLMDSQHFLHNSTRQETIDNPLRWAAGHRSKVTCSDVSESSCLFPESNRIQRDVPARYVAQRPMDSGVNVLSFLSNVQPHRVLNTLLNGAPPQQNLSIHQKVLSGIDQCRTAFQFRNYCYPRLWCHRLLYQFNVLIQNNYN